MQALTSQLFFNQRKENSLHYGWDLVVLQGISYLQPICVEKISALQIVMTQIDVVRSSMRACKIYCRSTIQKYHSR